MTIETGNYISALNASYPDGSDAKSEGDNHIRFVKTKVKETFPNVSGAVTPTHTVLTNYPDIYIYGTLVASTAWTQDMSQLQFWAQQRDEAMAEAMADTRKTKGKATLRTEFGGSRPNIMRGF